MKTLNLVNKEKSDIKYQISHFPDGQQNIVIPDQHPKIGTYETIWQSVQIKSRLNTFQDLELIICATKCLRGLGLKKIHLYTPYFMGARSDRKFEEGGNNYLRDVICPIINSLNFESVTVLDPHSDVLEACLNGFKKIDNLSLVKNAINSFYMNIYDNKPKSSTIDWEFRNNILNKFVLISPDAGASRKIHKLAEKIGYTGDIITCSKERDEYGKLTKCVVPLGIDNLEKDIIIIDDICDGGQTFINISKELDEIEGEIGKKYLIVTHGIFSKGISELGKYFDGIYCTNSYQDLEPENDGNDYVFPNLVEQLNVF